MRKDLQVKIKTPAKVNFYLFIKGKRSDGYHELSLDLFPVSFYDSLTFCKTDTEGLQLESNLSGLSLEENLVVKAIRLLEEEVGSRFSLKITLEKQIPWGAGLGGGSGNAAGTLVAVNQLCETGVSESRLYELAKKLGADVPFFINPRPSLATGIGERLTDLPVLSPFYLILLFPGFPISTKIAYANCSKSGRTLHNPDYGLSTIQNLTPEINDFWTSLSLEFPVLESCKSTLLEHGAIFSGLSGSGSTLYGIFTNLEDQEKAYQTLKNQPKWTLVKCQTLREHQYLSKR